MPKEMIISSNPGETWICILENGSLYEIFIERDDEKSILGNIYKGRVSKVLPGMQSAFIDIGLQRDAFLYIEDFQENMEDYLIKRLGTLWDKVKDAYGDYKTGKITKKQMIAKCLKTTGKKFAKAIIGRK